MNTFLSLGIFFVAINCLAFMLFNYIFIVKDAVNSINYYSEKEIKAKKKKIQEVLISSVIFDIVSIYLMFIYFSFTTITIYFISSFILLFLILEDYNDILRIIEENKFLYYKKRVALSKLRHEIYSHNNISKKELDEIYTVVEHMINHTISIEDLNDRIEIIRITINKLNAANSTNKNANNIKFTSETIKAFNILEVKQTATINEIKSSYRRLVKIHHPDKQGNTDNFVKINNAYNHLKKYYNF